MKSPHNKTHEASSNTQIPIGLEKLLVLAASDSNFRKELMDNREFALKSAGFNLRPFEESALKATSNKQLEVMICAVAPSKPKRRRVRGLIAAVTTTLAVGTLLAEGACGGAPADVVAGSRPEVDFGYVNSLQKHNSEALLVDAGLEADSGPKDNSTEFSQEDDSANLSPKVQPGSL